VTDGDAVPPSPADGAGVLTVVVPVDRHEDATSACIVPDADAAKALSTYRGDGTAIAGTQFLVDPQGRLRALWYPGLTPDWNDPAALDREVATLRATPAIGRPVRPGGHAH
jgi:hypothetical protein